MDPIIFSQPLRRDILHLCINHYRDGLRQGTASTKTRGEVRASGRKLRPQKGSGRARLGDAGSPMLRGGGVAFGPKPRDFSTKLPRKVIHLGLRVALSARLREGRMGIVPTMVWPGVKTARFDMRIRQLGWDKTLFVTGEERIPDGLERSTRAIRNIDVKLAKDITIYDILRWRRIVMDIPAANFLEDALQQRMTLRAILRERRKKGLADGTA